MIDKPLCDLSKHFTETPTHYVGISSTEYAIKEYEAHGRGGTYRGHKDLPANDFPYSIKYQKKRLFICCELCQTCEKHKL